MRKNVLRVFSCFLAVVVLSLSVFPAQAVNTEYTSVESFWNWVAGSGDIAQGILSHIPIGSRDNVCAKSDDGYHQTDLQKMEETVIFYAFAEIAVESLEAMSRTCPLSTTTTSKPSRPKATIPAAAYVGPQSPYIYGLIPVFQVADGIIVRIILALM